MPSFTHDQLRAAQKRFTNNQLTGTSYNSGSYLVVDLSSEETGVPIISVDPLVEVAVKDYVTSSHIQSEYGGNPLSRGWIQSGKADLNSRDRLPYTDAPKTRRLLTVGAVITLVDPEGNTAIPLHLRNGNVPLAGKMTNPSGLASETPDQALWNRINQESGYCYVDKDKKIINVIILEPDDETKQANRGLSQQISYNKMKGQHAIRAAVAAATGIEEVRSTEKWDIQHVRVDSKLDFTPEQEASGMIQHVVFGGSLPQTTLPAHVHDDKNRQTVTLTVPLRASVPFPLKHMIFIDPEGYSREVKLHTEAELKAIGDTGVPALNSYVRRLNGELEPSPVPVAVAAPAPVAT